MNKPSNKTDDSLEVMLTDGSMELAGVAENGEALYVFNADVLRKLHPTVYSKQHEAFLMKVTELWDKGYLDIVFTDDDIEITLNEKSFVPGDDLDSSEKELLMAIAEVLVSEG